MKNRLHTSFIAIFTALAAPALAQQVPTTKAAPASASSGAYSLNLLYTGEGWDVVSGGLKRGGSYMYNIDGQFSVDMGKAFGLTGGTFYVEGFYANATSTGNSWVGALDQQSPIDTAANVEMFRLYQLYYDQSFGKTDVRFGKYDLETEFSLTKPMSLFLSKNLTWNTALDQAGTMPANGTVGPGNYPYTPLALRIRQDFGQGVSAQFAIANAVSDDPHHLGDNGLTFGSMYGATFIGEADYQPDKHTKLMLGAWDTTGKLPSYGLLNADGSQRMGYNQFGGYLGGAARIYSVDPHRGLDVFLTAGFSSPRATNVTEAVNGGLVYTGLFSFRPADKAGVSFNVNFAPDSWKAYQASMGNVIAGAESSFELTYRAKINEFLTVQPDIQYIVQPAYSKTLKNPVVLGLHFEIGKLLTW